MQSIIQKAHLFQEKIAIIDGYGKHTYQELLENKQKIATFLIRHFKKDDLEEACIAFMAVQNAYYVAMQWGIWQAGGIAVPISITHPEAEIDYLIEDTNTKIVFCTRDDIHKFQSYTKMVFTIEDILENTHKIHSNLPNIHIDRRAMIIYTSGTTSRPKGVVSTFKNIETQIYTLVAAWEWKPTDIILHVLPLHHIHGIINALACALWSGAEVLMLPKFNATTVWKHWLDKKHTLFMAVPTIYHKLIDAWDEQDDFTKEKYSQALHHMRLMVSGSAALPVSVLEKWKEISGHTLLERYGMTEIGMAISNPLHGTRKPGYIGTPLPGVKVELVDEMHQVIHKGAVSGEIRVKSDAVFKEYWQKEAATQKTFYEGWFYTGDIAERDEEGYYKILGRNSLDIIKTGGYKVSALEIESAMLQHPLIAECAVVGIPNIQWGEMVAAAIVFKQKQTDINKEELKTWAKEKLAHYKIPTLIKKVEELPRNTMGKLLKNKIKEIF